MYPISTFCNWIPVIIYPCDLHINKAPFNGFLPPSLTGSQSMGELESQEQLNFRSSLTVNHIMHFVPVLLWERFLDSQHVMAV